MYGKISCRKATKMGGYSNDFNWLFDQRFLCCQLNLKYLGGPKSKIVKKKIENREKC